MPDDKNISFRSKVGDMERDLDVLKRSKSESISNEELQSSIDGLSKNIEQMMKVFKLAVDEIKLDEHDEDTVATRLEPIMQKLNELTQQNEKIADGVVAVADMIKDHMDKEMSEFKTVESRIGQMSMPPPMPPRAPSQQPGPFSDMPSDFDNDFSFNKNMMPPAPGFAPMPPAPGMNPPPGSQMSFGMDALSQKQPDKKKGLFGFGK